MALISVDSGACLRDGICVEACPAFVLAMPDNGDCPLPVDGAENFCSRCGHCVSVCPTGALSLSFMSVAECVEARPDQLPSEAQFAQLVRSRRSIRNFRDQPLPREALLGLLDLARYAPSGSNRQPVEWLVLDQRAVVREFAALALDWLRVARPDYAHLVAVADTRGLDVICRGAPQVAIAHTPKGREVDGIIALAHLELAAHVQGFGACWCGFANGAINDWAAAREAIQFPEGRSSAGVMLLGYPRYGHERIPQRNPLRVEWR